MNILQISRTMGQGGAEKVVYQLCKEKNKNITMIIASTGGYYEEMLNKYGVKHYCIPDIDGKKPIQIIKTYLILRKIVLVEKIDIIHSHHRMAAFYARILNIFHPKLKRIYTAHNVFNNRIKLTQFSLQKSVVIACGSGVKNNLVNCFKIMPDRIKIIYNSIENNVIKKNIKNNEISKINNKILIGTIGRLSEQKGIDIFIKAIDKVSKKNKNVLGIIIGDGELRNDLETLVHNLKLTNKIMFLGFKANVLELINSLDFVVLASRWEGFPLTPIETFSQKKTIIASNIDGNNEIVIDNKNGLLFEKDNIEDLTSKMNYMITNTAKRTEMEKNAYKAYLEKYSYNIFIKNYYDQYKKMM